MEGASHCSGEVESSLLAGWPGPVCSSVCVQVQQKGAAVLFNIPLQAWLHSDPLLGLREAGQKFRHIFVLSPSSTQAGHSAIGEGLR